MSRRLVTIGLLLVMYKGGRDEQPIKWVRLDDAVRLQGHLAACASLAKRVAEIQSQINDLREQGLNDAQLKAAGIDTERFKQMATSDDTWVLHSYKIEPIAGGRMHMLRINRTHRLQIRSVESVRLVHRQSIED